MGLDDLARVQFVPAGLALILTLLISGPATLLSYGAWRWSLSLLAKGHGVRASRVASVLALAVTGLPAAYTLALFVALPGIFGAAGLLLVLGVAFSALVHAAFRDEFIRARGEDQDLAARLAALDVWEREVWLREAGRAAAAAPPFTGTTKRRALKRAVLVALGWVAPFVLLSLAHS